MANTETQGGQRPPETPKTGPTLPAAAHPLKPKRGLRALIGLVLVLVIVGLGGLWAKHRRTAQAATSGSQGQRGPGGGPVPVVAGTVGQKDVPIYLDGLGTVQAFNTVTVRARVDGQVEKIAFVEGQDVHAGDLLAKIDPKPFQTLVEQNKARKAQDEAQLANARLQLKRNADLLANKILAQQDYDTQK